MESLGGRKWPVYHLVVSFLSGDLDGPALIPKWSRASWWHQSWEYMTYEHILCKMCLSHVQKIKKALDKGLSIKYWRFFKIILTIWVHWHLRKMSGSGLDVAGKNWKKIPSNIVVNILYKQYVPKYAFKTLTWAHFPKKYAFANSNPHKLALTWTGAFVLCYFCWWWTGHPLVIWDVAELWWILIFPPAKWGSCPWAGSCGWAVSCLMEFTLLSCMSAFLLSTLK